MWTNFSELHYLVHPPQTRNFDHSRKGWLTLKWDPRDPEIVPVSIDYVGN